jgi:hypothetical protein
MGAMPIPWFGWFLTGFEACIDFEGSALETCISNQTNASSGLIFNRRATDAGNSASMTIVVSRTSE